VASRRQIDSGFGQLKWAVLLLGAAVILPSVCLLWFMSQVIGNERLAARQKLVKIQQEQLARLTYDADRDWAQNIELLSKSKTSAHPYEGFLLLAVQSGYDGLVVFDNSGRCTYPMQSALAERETETVEQFQQAWQSEFVEGELAAAAKLYQTMTKSISSTIRFKALLGSGRCLAKLGRIDEAIDECEQVAFSALEDRADSTQLKLIANSRLLLLKYTKDPPEYSDIYEDCFKKLISMVYWANQAGAVLSSDYNLFLARKVLEIMQENQYLADTNKQKAQRIKKLAAAEELSIKVSEIYNSVGYISKDRQNRFEKLQVGGQDVYGLFARSTDGKFLIIKRAEAIDSAFLNYENKFKESGVAYKVVDENDNFICGMENPDDEPFAAAAVSGYLPGWRVELFFEGEEIFEKAASERIAVYVWTAIVVILLIFVLGVFSAQALTKQIRVNRLKNDFIATVSHELKTPLASMRVLVDTLLDKNYESPHTVNEYLHLICKENERLSRMIDNFLSFSRMERNKQAFDMAKVSPVEIANTAVEAMQTKFHNGDVDFDVKISRPVGMIYADKDAMVTVLVNLLDNAYKYTNNDKHIELRVFQKNGLVCFAVEDNGVGIPKRLRRKIFSRFYQVDRTLTRQAGGTGLGLSIVKFIVDAHKGKIDVDSKPGKGSVFTVKLTAIKNGNGTNS